MRERVHESQVALFEAELIGLRGARRNLESVEDATLEWVGWPSNRWLLGRIGNIVPIERKGAYCYTQEETLAMAAGLT